MGWNRIAVVCGVASLTLMACGDKGEDSGGTPSASWAEAFDTTATGALSGVWGTGPDDVFIVGGSDAGGESYHYDGSDWSPMTVPDGTGLLVWSFGFSPSDVYAVGLEGSVVHYDGSAWTVLDSGTEESLWGVWGTSGTDLWIVGGDADVGVPLILHYDGSTFTETPLDPAQNSRLATTVFKVWGIGSKVFAVGQRGLIIEWDGSQWVENLAGADADQDFVSLWGTSEDHIVAVGGRSNGRIAEYDGTSWTTTSLSGLGGMNAVFMDDPEQAIIGGVGGWVGTYGPTDDDLSPETSVVTQDVHAIWGDGTGTYYAVGGRFSAPYSGVAMVRTQ